jgi:hypothetical protein
MNQIILEFQSDYEDFMKLKLLYSCIFVIHYDCEAHCVTQTGTYHC